MTVDPFDRRTHIERLNPLHSAKELDMADDIALRTAAVSAATAVRASGEDDKVTLARASRYLAWIKGERDPEVVAAEADELAAANHRKAVAQAEAEAAEATARAAALRNATPPATASDAVDTAPAKPVSALPGLTKAGA